MRQHLAAGLLSAALATSTLVLAPAAHADGTARDYALSDCDVQVEVTEWTPDRTVTTTTTKIANWTTEISLRLPNPLPAGEWAPAAFDLGPIGTGFLPFELASSATSDYTVTLVDRAGAPAMALTGTDRYPSIPDDASLDFPAHVSYVQARAGARELRPHEVAFALAGADPTGRKWAEIRGACDPLVAATPLLTQYVYDLDAPTDIITSTAAPMQGRDLGFTAYHLLEVAPSTSDARIPVMVTLGGSPVGNFIADASGTVTGSFTIPCCLYGDQELRVVNGSRVASVIVHLPGVTPLGPGVPSDLRPALTLRETFPAKVAAGGRARGSVRVSAPKGFRGSVKIVEGTRLLGTANVVAGRSGTVTLKKLSRGRRQLSLIWTGSDAYAGYQPTTRTFAVVQR